MGGSSEARNEYIDQGPVHCLAHDDREDEARSPDELPDWETIEAGDLEQHVLAGRSVLITGYPGTGKTYIARRLVGKLREAGKLVEIVSKTHVSVQNVGLGAKTADHWTRKHI